FTQVLNKVKSVLTSDIKNQLETTKNSIDSLKHRLDIYEQNQNKFITSMQCISNEHGIKIQRIEETLTSTTTILENLSTPSSVLQTTMDSILPYIQNWDNNINNILNTTNNSSCAIATANPILTAKIHDKMRYFNRFDDFEPQISNNHYKSSNRLAALNKIPEEQLSHPKDEVEKLFSFEVTSPEVSDVEEMLNSGGCHSYTTPMPHEIIKTDDPRWTNLQSLIPAKPKNLPIW
ncbi:4823_t:CDS:2, partial [Dentiscutata heterogama]